MIQNKPDGVAFLLLKAELEQGHQLTLKDIANVFGWPGVELMLYLSTNEKLDDNMMTLLRQIRDELKEKK